MSQTSEPDWDSENDTPRKRPRKANFSKEEESLILDYVVANPKKPLRTTLKSLIENKVRAFVFIRFFKQRLMFLITTNFAFACRL